MKKHLLLTAIVLALVLCFSCGIFAADITSEEGNANQYLITEKLQNFTSDDLWIGTLADWKADGNKIGDTDTALDNGEAIHEDDIIISNGKICIALAVGTRNPWGYPAGSILDAGYCDIDGKPTRDTVWAIEFLVHRWNSWAPDNCGVVTFDVVKYDFETGAESADTGVDAVKVSRIHNQEENIPFDVVTYYSLGQIAGEDVIYMFTKMTNNGEKEIMLKNDLAITNKGDDGGAMVNETSRHIAGNYGNVEGKTFSSFVLDVSATDAEWKAGTAYNKGSVGYKELVCNNTYKPGESKLLKHYAVIDEEASTEAVNNVQNVLKEYTTTVVSGTVTDASGAPVENPVIIVEEKGATYGWYIGESDGTFSFDLPEGEFSAFVERDGHAAGVSVDITEDNASNLELKAGGKKETVTINLKDQDGKAVYGRVELFVPGKDEGTWVSAYPTVRYCGDSVYLDKVSANDPKGQIKVDVAPGKFKAVVYGEGFWFYSNPVEIIGDTANAEDLTQDVTINMVYDAPEGYLSGDLHHHANKNDAFADPTDAIPSMMASGLDVALITDHDYTVNNYKGYQLAQEYGMEGFLPSEEITCSWAHFNVLPLDKASYYYFLDKTSENHVMDQFGKLPDFVEETHQYGAAITANHPWYSYGLFTNKHKAPGGYTDDYDNIEINSCDTPASITNTILSATQLWTAFITGEEDEFFGEVENPHYLVGGSDTHDVLYRGFADDNYKNTKRSSTDYVSGKVRTFAEVGEVTKNDVVANGLKFANAVANGESFTTFGPLLTLDKTPGNLYIEDTGVFKLKVEVESLETIDDVIVMSSSAKDTYANKKLGSDVPYEKAISKEDVNAKTCTVEVEYTMDYNEVSGWIAILVVDANGSIAITNPYWILNGAEYEVPFTDVNDTDYFAEAVEWAYFTGVTTGATDTTFAPDDNCTRAQAVTFLWRACGEPVATTAENPFTDVDKDDYYYDAVLWAAENGIAKGITNTTFGPDVKVTRAQMVTFIWRAAGEPEVAADECVFTDIQESEYYYEAALWGAENGIVKGMTDTTFDPSGFCLRGQAVTFLYRFASL